jgi:hypothetical protein
VKPPMAVLMAIVVGAVMAAGIEEEAEGAVAAMTVLAHCAGAGTPVTTIGVVSRATGLMTVEASSP